MAKTYTATLDLRCGKEHTCRGCGAVYSYLFVRKATGTASTADAAQQNARKNANRLLAESVDPRPCPTCGLLQPDMIAQGRRGNHWKVFWLALVVLIVLLLLRCNYVLSANTATWAFTGVCALAALAFAATDLKDPNRDPEANRRASADRVTAGTMFLHAPGRTGPPADEWARPPRGLLHRLAFPLLALAVLLAASPELLRMARGWPLNADAWPPVVGPGDSTRVYMTDKITSIHGYWRGTPDVTLKVPGGADVKISATTNQKDWGRSISVKSSEKDDSATPWARLEIPPGPALAGKTVDCEITLAIEYPRAFGPSSFEERHDELTRSLSLRLAPAGAGGQYESWWWAGTVGAIALLLFCGMTLAGAAAALRRTANPTRILQ